MLGWMGSWEIWKVENFSTGSAQSGGTKKAECSEERCWALHFFSMRQTLSLYWGFWKKTLALRKKRQMDTWAFPSSQSQRNSYEMLSDTKTRRDYLLYTSMINPFFSFSLPIRGVTIRLNSDVVRIMIHGSCIHVGSFRAMQYDTIQWVEI